MKIYTEQSLKDFEFWSGAKSNATMMTCEELDSVESELEELYPDGMTDTEINDFFLFEEDTIADWLGYNSFEELIEESDREDDDE